MPANPLARPRPGDTHANSVLIVDDNPAVRELTRVVLERSGREVVVAEDGIAATLLLESRPFAFVLTDLNMPGRSGLEVIADARRLQPAIQVVAMSGDWVEGREDFRAAAAKLAIRALLNKPFSIRELLAALGAEPAWPEAAKSAGGLAVA